MAAASTIGGSLPLSVPLHPFGDHPPTFASLSGLSSSLYAYGLPSALTDSDLHDLFGMYGAVSSVHIMRNDNGTPKGYAFINMKSVHDAAVAQLYLDLLPIGGRTLRVNFKSTQHNSNSTPKQQHRDRHNSHHTAATNNNNTNTATNTSEQQQQQHEQPQQQLQQSHLTQPSTDSRQDDTSNGNTD